MPWRRTFREEVPRRCRRPDARCPSSTTSTPSPIRSWTRSAARCVALPRRPRRGSWMTDLTLAKALNEGLRKAMEDDAKVLLIGEDIGKLGGVFRVTDGLQKDFGEHAGHRRAAGRVRRSWGRRSGSRCAATGPSSRSSSTASSTRRSTRSSPRWPSSTTGPRARWDMPAGHPHPVRRRHRGGRAPLRVPRGLLRAHRRLRVVSPRDAERRLLDDPPGDRAATTRSIFFEPKCRYWEKGDGRRGRRRARRRCSPAAVSARRHRRDARRLRARDEDRACAPPRRRRRRASSLEVIDLRSSRRSTSTRSPRPSRRPGRLIIAHEAPVFGGIGAEIAARLTERCFYSLAAPPLRVGGYATPVPAVAGRGALPARASTGCSTRSTGRSSTEMRAPR